MYYSKMNLPEGLADLDQPVNKAMYTDMYSQLVGKKCGQADDTPVKKCVIH